MSLRAFVDLIRSGYTIGYWSKWENSPDHPLTRQARTELRLAVGLPALPPTVSDATAAADPDATVYLVGDESATRIVMVGRDVDAVTLRINGHATVIEEAAPAVLVSPDTRPRDRSSYAGLSVRRETKKRLGAARRASGQTWDEFLSQIES